MDVNRLLTVAEAARLRGVSRDTVYDWLTKGLRPARVHPILIDPAALAAFRPQPVGNPEFSSDRNSNPT